MIPSCVARASSRIPYEEELRSPQAVFGRSRFRAILTSDTKGKTLAANSILDDRTKDLCWVELGEEGLQSGLRDKAKGIAAQVYRQNTDYRIQETLARIAANGVSIQVRGKKVNNRIPVMDFRAEIVLSPRLAAGRVYFETVKNEIQVSSGPNDFFATLLSPIIYRSVKDAIEKFAEKELAVNRLPSTVPGTTNSGYGVPLGIILVNGALDMYY
jgi:hypothetical protein